jgi:alkylation response protein AidB-like acyl-CoA dehydrogenase
MMFDLPDDVKNVQEMVRRVANERVSPRAHEIDRSGEYPQDMFDLLRELGMFTLPFPAEHGGLRGGRGTGARLL